MAQHGKNMIGGELSAAGSQKFRALNPATGESISTGCGEALNRRGGGDALFPNRITAHVVDGVWSEFALLEHDAVSISKTCHGGILTGR